MRDCLSLSSLAFILQFSSFPFFVDIANGATNAITPIPMELLNPRLTEFRRIDSSGDDQITFSEFLLSDRPWMETVSRRFHSIDANSDGKVTRKEFETYFRGKDEEQEGLRNHQADTFFKQLTVTVGPIVERDQEGDAQNGSRRMRYFTAGSRKFAAITHGTGLFPPSSPSSAELSASHAPDFDYHHHFNNFPHHAQFLLPSSATILGSLSAQQQRGGGPMLEQRQVTSVPTQNVAIQREKSLKML